MGSGMAGSMMGFVCCADCVLELFLVGETEGEGDIILCLHVFA